jgi:hypothetical protein
MEETDLILAYAPRAQSWGPECGQADTPPPKAFGLSKLRVLS